jgi:hypothetical protein
LHTGAEFMPWRAACQDSVGCPPRSAGPMLRESGMEKSLVIAELDAGRLA